MEPHMIIKFQKYLKDELPKEIEKNIRDDAELRKDFIFFKATYEVVQENRRKELKNEMRQHSNKSVSINHKLYRHTAIAATLLFLFSFPIYNYFTYSDKIFLKHNIIQDREFHNNYMEQDNKKDTMETDIYIIALYNFKKQDYEEADRLFSRIKYSEKNYERYFKAQYYIALCCVVQKKEDEAKKVLKNIIEHKHFSNKNYKDHWIRDRAEQFLNDISNSRFPFF